MRSSRSGKPLFEHLSAEQVEVDVATMPDPTTGEQPGHRRRGVSPIILYLVIAGGIVVAIACWSFGYRSGYRAGESAWTDRGAEHILLPPTDPLAGPDGLEKDARGGMEGSGDPGEGSRGEVLAREGVNGSKGAILSSRGVLDGDPRQEGFNYLELATLSEEQAISAIRFLSMKGVDAIAVPSLETGVGGANNPVRYRLISVEVAIPGDSFRAMRAERLDHERLMERLGAEWQKEYDGASSFGRPLWKRYP